MGLRSQPENRQNFFFLSCILIRKSEQEFWLIMTVMWRPQFSVRLLCSTCQRFLLGNCKVIINKPAIVAAFMPAHCIMYLCFYLVLVVFKLKHYTVSVQLPESPVAFIVFVCILSLLCSFSKGFLLYCFHCVHLFWLAMQAFKCTDKG